MDRSFPANTCGEPDPSLAEDRGLKSASSSFDERIPSQSGTPSVEFVKHDRIREGGESLSTTAVGDENSCPNAETVPLKGGEARESEACAVKHESPLAPGGAESKARSDEPVNDYLNDDVSMMSVDGNMSVDCGPQREDSIIAREYGGNSNTVSRGNSTFASSEPRRNSTVPASNVEIEVQVRNSLHQESHLSTPVDKSIRAPRVSSICDEDEIFLTPNQGSVQESSTKKPSSPHEESNLGEQSELKKECNKDGVEIATVGAKASETFELEASAADVNNTVCSRRSLDFDLRLDSTCQEEESRTAPPGRTVEQMSTPVRKEFRGTFTYGRLSENESEAAADKGIASSEPHEDGEEPGAKERRSSSFKKRPCSILELSFVSSPKRGNFSMKTPKASGKDPRTSLINFNESIAFDFSAAAKSAETNGGVAEMGSFVFSSSSGLPVAGSEDPFDLRTLERATKQTASKDEKYTRVSFIAMFDPIKIQEGEQQTKDKTEAVQNKRFSSVASQSMSSNDSPLIKGLPAPAFAKPKPVKVASKTVEVQTDPVVEETEPSTELLPIQEEVENELVRLNEMVEKQAQALSTYEQVVKKLIDARRERLANPDEDSKLKRRLSEERLRNERLEEAVKSMECSMRSTLMRMQEFRTANEDLREVVEEQQAALVETRSEFEDRQRQWEQDTTARNEEKQALEARIDESSRAHEKAVSMLNLQLQAKESEIESLNMQLSISRKEVDSLRSVVNSMKLQ